MPFHFHFFVFFFCFCFISTNRYHFPLFDWYAHVCALLAKVVHHRPQCKIKTFHLRQQSPFGVDTRYDNQKDLATRLNTYLMLNVLTWFDTNDVHLSICQWQWPLHSYNTSHNGCHNHRVCVFNFYTSLMWWVQVCVCAFGLLSCNIYYLNRVCTSTCVCVYVFFCVSHFVTLTLALSSHCVFYTLSLTLTSFPFILL